MSPHHNDRAIWFVIFVFLIFLVGNFIFTQYEIAQIKGNLVPQTSSPFIYATISPAILSLPPVVSTAIPTSTLIPTATPTSKPTSVPANKITYIPLTGGNTQNTDWANVSGSNFTLNISDYGSKAYAIWDANLRVDNANGTTYARLFDTTHGIAVNGSEISVTNTSVSTDITSGQLQFWQGNNSYVVQVKSLNSSIAFMDSGRIKINY